MSALAGVSLVKQDVVTDLLEIPPFEISCKPSTSMADIKADLEKYQKTINEILEFYKSDDTEDLTELRKLNQALTKWLALDTTDHIPLECLEEWQSQVERVKAVEGAGFHVLDIPSIAIKKG